MKIFGLWLALMASGGVLADDNHALPGPAAETASADPGALPVPQVQIPACGAPCGKVCTVSQARKLAADCETKYPATSLYFLGDRQWSLIQVSENGRQLWYDFDRRKISDNPVKDSPGPSEKLGGSVPKDVRYALLHRWVRDQSTAHRVAMYPMRLVPRLISPIIKGRAVQTLVLNPLQGLYHLAGAARAEDGEHQRELLARAGYEFADPISPLVVTNRALADLTQVLQAPSHARAKMSSRIQMCSANLMTGIVDPSPDAPFKVPAVAYRVAPIVNAISIGDHVGLLIDDLLYETDDPSPTHRHLTRGKSLGGVFCSPVPLLKDQSESVAIECLRCMDGFFNTPAGRLPYKVERYNCAAYTKDLLGMCGMGYAGVINFGVGSELGFSFSAERRLKLEAGRRFCARQSEDQRNLIFSTENGKDISGNALFATLDATGPDFRLQMIASAARGKNPSSRQWVLERVREVDFQQAYLVRTRTGATKVKASAEDFFKDAFEGLDAEAYEWMRARFPEATSLYERYCGAKKIDPRTQKPL